MSYQSQSNGSLVHRGLIELPGLVFKHANTENVREFLQSAAASDVSGAQRILSENWVDTVGDIRLLIHEGLLREIGLSSKLCQWMEQEVSVIVSATDASPIAAGAVASPATLSLLSRPDLQPRLFRRSSDFDTNGLIYWLGTRNQPAGKFTNPASLGLVRATASGMMKNSWPIEAVTDRELVRCVTAASAEAFIMLELKDCMLLPTQYTLKHYLSWDTECVRNWRLEGSRDGVIFTTLRDHQEDTAVNGIGGTHTWDIAIDPAISTRSSPYEFIGAKLMAKYYRFFKLQLTGPNSNNHLYLACSGIELYGALLTSHQYETINSAITAASLESASMANGRHPSVNAANLLMPPLEDVEMRAPSPAAASPMYAPSNAGVDYIYANDFDENGIIHAIATRNCTVSWSNPADAGLIKLVASSLLDDSARLNAIVGHQCVRCVTQSKPSSWMMLDLLDKTVLLTAYTLRHYSSWDTEALRHWRIEGSTNGATWVSLREHRDDVSLDAKCKTATWFIDLNRSGADRPYRCFRILQLGENSNKHHHLACSGIELYGKLYAVDGCSTYNWSAPMTALSVRSSPAMLDSGELQFRHVSDFDTNGIIHYLATGGLSREWTNPHLAGILHVSASSLADDSVGVEAVVGHSTVRCVTQSMVNSWIVIDLQTTFVRPSAYSLRHYATWDNEALRNWRFEGSVNGSAGPWILIREHRSDTALEGKGSTHTWSATSSYYFRAFRIVQFDENSNRHYYLACSGFELYGTLRQSLPPASIPPPVIAADARVSPSPVSASRRSANREDGISPMELSSARNVTPPATPTTVIASQLFPHASNSAVFASFPPAPPVTAVHRHSEPSVSLQASNPMYFWDADCHGSFITVDAAHSSIARNGRSNDKWQMVRSAQSFESGVVKIGVRIVNDAKTTNTWRFIIGAIPASLDLRTSKQWVGTQGSWGVIAGTGGKCHLEAKSIQYSVPFGLNDLIGLTLDFAARTIEFSRNGQLLGVAFDDLIAPVRIAVSMTAEESAVQLLPYRAAPSALAVHHSQSVSTNPFSSPVHAHPPAVPRVMSLPTGAAGNSQWSGWDETHKSQFLQIEPNRAIIKNLGSNDKWQTVRSAQQFTRANGSVQSFSIELLQSGSTPNSWQIIVGVVPPSFTCSGNKQWVGAGGSWGYIGGTGGKCFNAPKSIPYGAAFGNSGDVITVTLSFDMGTIEFKKNGVSQGVAFDSLVGPVHAAVSLTATGSTAQLIAH